MPSTSNVLDNSVDSPIGARLRCAHHPGTATLQRSRAIERSLRLRHAARPVRRGSRGMHAAHRAWSAWRRSGRRAPARATSTPRRRGPCTTATRSAPASTPRASPSARPTRRGSHRSSTGRSTASRSRPPGASSWRRRTTPCTRWPPTPARSCGPPTSGPRCPRATSLRGHRPDGRHHRHPGASTPPAARSSPWPTSWSTARRPTSWWDSTSTPGPSNSTRPSTRRDRTRPTSCNAPG